MKSVRSSVRAWGLRVAGGPARARVLILLAAVLGLDTADLGAVGATASKLEHALSLSNTQVGLLAAMPSICSALFALPMGILSDRTNRVRLLWITMLIWSAAQALSATADSFQTLLFIRMGLGAATAVTLPAVASLVGDLFPAAERGHVWGLILSGELIGAAFGYMVAGEAASFGPGSWRYAFLALAVPSVVAALAVRAWLREPVRGGGGQLRPGASEVVAAADDPPDGASTSEQEQVEPTRAQEEVEKQGVEPVQEQILHSDPEGMSIWQAGRYVLSIRTNVVLIIASALGYFYFTGVTTFGLEYFQDRYHIPHGEATLLVALVGLGGLGGVIGGGLLADRGLRHGSVNSRIVVGALSFAVSALLFFPGLLAGSMAIALPLMILAAIAFGARNPPLDAARLDIMHHRLWGRAEAVRSFLRRSLTATAPIVFGFIADQLAPGGRHSSSSGAQGFGANTNAHGLELASLILLVTLVLGGILTLLALRTYPRDVATASASESATAGQPAGDRLDDRAG